MTNMSAAALPPRQPSISEQDRKHPRFGEYQHYRASMSRLLVEASAFGDWISQGEFEKLCDSWVAHPRYKEFMKWMVETKAGGRKSHGCFPDNFIAWIDGARW